MGVFNAGGVGFDLGSSNVTIYLENEGIVLREASYLLTSADDSMDILAAARSIRRGAGAFDQAIVRFVRREKGLIIGQRTAEDLKIDIGTAVESKITEDFEVVLRGRDARTGKPSTVNVSVAEVRKALQDPIEDMLESMREAFENTPPELAADILERGVQLSGGGSLLEGLAKRIGDSLKLPVRASEEPQDDVAAGAGMIAADERLFARFVQTGCVIEI